MILLLLGYWVLCCAFLYDINRGKYHMTTLFLSVSFGGKLPQVSQVCCCLQSSRGAPVCRHDATYRLLRLILSVATPCFGCGFHRLKPPPLSNQQWHQWHHYVLLNRAKVFHEDSTSYSYEYEKRDIFALYSSINTVVVVLIIYVQQYTTRFLLLILIHTNSVVRVRLLKPSFGSI